MSVTVSRTWAKPELEMSAMPPSLPGGGRRTLGGHEPASPFVSRWIEPSTSSATSHQRWPQFSFDEAISLLVNCADLAEIGHYWIKLSDGGEERPCGWLNDRYGLPWQVVPVGWAELIADPDQARRRCSTSVLR